MNYHDDVTRRSGGRCEAMVRVGNTYARCWRTPVEVHHMLTRSRGGKILDAYGERAHLIALCPRHHKVAHEPGGHRKGLMIDGYVTTGEDGTPVYEGSDQRLLHYRRGGSAMDMPELYEDLSSYEPSEGL